MPARNRWPRLKRPALLVGFSFGAAFAAGLRNARELHASRLTRVQVRLVEEAAIRTIEIGRLAKALGMAVE